MKSIRESYQEQGVQSFYSQYGNNYSNPHENTIHKHLKNLIQKEHISGNNSVLDLCCGSGEVTRFLIGQGINNIEGIDPFTSKIYKNRTKKNCFELNFSEIAQGEMQKKYDIIICSFAMHLCDTSLLPSLLFRLALNSKKLIIISPHKKPDINFYWELNENYYFDRVRTRIFLNTIKI